MHINTLPISPPIIGLGTAALGRPGYINLGHAEAFEDGKSVEAMEAQAHKVLDFAEANGLLYLDAARSYGKAEAFISSWLAKDPARATRFAIGSKWGYTYVADWQTQADAHEIKEHSLAKLNEQWPLSQELLPGLSLYQIHSATFGTGVLENEAIHRRLHKLREEYGIAIGLSTSGTDQPALIEAALKVKVDGKRLFDAVQVTYNMLEQSTADQLKKAHDAGLKVIIKEALANGRLTAANTDVRFHTETKALFDLAQKHQTGIDAIALAFILKQPFVDIVLSGAATIPHLEANLKAYTVAMDGDDLERLASLDQGADAYWAARSGMAWN